MKTAKSGLVNLIFPLMIPSVLSAEESKIVDMFEISLGEYIVVTDVPASEMKSYFMGDDRGFYKDLSDELERRFGIEACGYVLEGIIRGENWGGTGRLQPGRETVDMSLGSPGGIGKISQKMPNQFRVAQVGYGCSPDIEDLDALQETVYTSN